MQFILAQKVKNELNKAALFKTKHVRKYDSNGQERILLSVSTIEFRNFLFSA